MFPLIVSIINDHAKACSCTRLPVKATGTYLYQMLAGQCNIKTRSLVNATCIALVWLTLVLSVFCTCSSDLTLSENAGLLLRGRRRK